MLSAKQFVTTFVAATVFSLPHFADAANRLDQADQLTRQFIEKTMSEQRIPGLQIAVVKDGQVVLSQSYGFANVENGAAVTATTRFPINSATKPFTGVAMMQLVEAGKVELDAPVSRYLDDLPQAWRAIRVRQLLAHTSGLPDIVDDQGLVGGGSEADAWKLVKARPMEAAIGERFSYNQANYALLAQIIAKQSGMPYERFIEQRQFAPVKMGSATFGDSYDPVANAATMYSYFPRKYDAKDQPARLSHWFYDMPHGLWAGGGMLTTAGDVAHWIVALSQGRLISQTNVRGMWVPEKLNSGADGNWSAGWPVLGSASDRQVAGVGGARAAFVVYPEDRLAIVVLTNLVGANPERFIPKIAAFYRPTRPAQAATAR